MLTEYVTNNIEPEDWLRKWLKESNESILHEQELTSPEGKKYLDALTFKHAKDNDTSISRFTVYKNGNHYFFVKVSCSVNDYETMAKKIKHISSTFGF